MAFLASPIEHDLFLSYAHQDVEWVNPLQKQLTKRLVERLGSGCRVKIWFDENELRTGHDVPEVLFKAIRASAAFIAVLSRNYPGSKWCEKELAAFLQEARNQDALETGGYGRLLKVIKFAWRDNAHVKFYPDYKHVSFFGRDAESDTEREFRPDSAQFENAVEKLSSDIENLFQAMLLGLEKVFVAQVPEDAEKERGSLIGEIRAAGYALSPPPQGDIPKGFDRDEIRKYIREATRASVHLLGAVFDSAVREQIDDALEEGKKAIFYLTRGHEVATGKQKELIDEIRENKWNLPAGRYALLANRSRLEDLIKLLRPPRPAAAGAGNGAAQVYILCDPNSEDAVFAREVQCKIQDQEHFDVVLPQAAANTSSRAAEHERLLLGCDGLLLYHEKAPPRWYKSNFNDLLTAEDRKRERELKSKALLATDTKVAFPGLTVIQRREPILQQLEPFLAPLRTGQGDAAHAGS